jgi:hypothetical protein
MFMGDNFLGVDLAVCVHRDHQDVNWDGPNSWYVCSECPDGWIPCVNCEYPANSVHYDSGSTIYPTYYCNQHNPSHVQRDTPVVLPPPIEVLCKKDYYGIDCDCGRCGEKRPIRC